MNWLEMEENKIINACIYKTKYRYQTFLCYLQKKKKIVLAFKQCKMKYLFGMCILIHYKKIIKNK